MADRFLDFYNSELAALRERAGRFAQAFPKIAGRLRLAPDTADDPHVERLIQSFAYTAARVRQKLDDSLPELTDSLLETLYPHYLAPMPALTILRLTPDPGLDGVRPVPRGTAVASDPVDGDTVRFTTTQEVPLAPVTIRSASLGARPFQAPPAPSEAATACLRLTLAPTGQAPLKALGLTRLRVFLSGPAAEAQALARLFLVHGAGLALADHADDAEPQRLGPDAIRPVSFDPDTALIPWPEGTFEGYRILSEFAALPERALFFDIALPPLTQEDRAELFLYFTLPPEDALARVDAASFTLNATPAVNLFPARAEPIALDGTRSFYPLMADARRPRSRRVHSVRRVTLALPDGSTLPCPPVFHRMTDHAPGGTFWQLRRHGSGDGHAEGATSIAFVDHRGLANPRAETTASVEILATNGSLPRRLPYGGGQPRLTVATPLDHVAGVTALRAPTPMRPARSDGDRAWQLLSHLSLNHLSLSREGAPALRDILRLYDPAHTPEMAQMISAIDDLQTTPGLARISGVTVTGTDLTLVFDDSRISPGTAVVFAATLDRFLGGYTTINSFTRLSVRMKDRVDWLARFPARAGEGALI